MAKTAKDYKVTFPYKARDGVYYAEKGKRNSLPPVGDGRIATRNGKVGKYHRGEDRAMPTGTPVIVNNTKIGMSGSTGASSGPHLHIGRFTPTGADSKPQASGGFKFSQYPRRPRVVAKGQDSVNGKYVKIRTFYGYTYVYLHLSSIANISIGQKIK